MASFKQRSDVELAAKEILRMREVLNKILAERTGQPYERISRDTDRDYILSAEESVAYGLVDEVLTRPIKGKE